MGGTVTQPYPENKDYEQNGYQFSFPPPTKDEATGKIKHYSPDGLYRNFSSASLKYHSSADWLVPVYMEVRSLFIAFQSPLEALECVPDAVMSKNYPEACTYLCQIISYLSSINDEIYLKINPK